jgi:hypothetical protein
VLLTEAASYMEARLNSTLWDAATTDSQNRALVEATRELSARSWLGNRADTTQALSWPRQWVTNPDSPNSDYYSNAIIPQRVKDATCELAFQFIKAGTTDIASLDSTQGVKRKKIDVIETEYETYARKEGLARYPSVLRFIAPLLQGSSHVVPTVRG